MKQAPVLTERDAKRILQHCKQTAFPDRNRCVFMRNHPIATACLSLS